MTYVKHIVERGTKLDRFQAAFCAFFLFPCHFYTRVIAFVGFLYLPDERSIRKTRFPLFITYVQRPVAPVIERLVRTIVTPWSGITWAYYVGCNCTVDVITTRCLCAFALGFAIMGTKLYSFQSYIFLLPTLSLLSKLNMHLVFSSSFEYNI